MQLHRWCAAEGLPPERQGVHRRAGAHAPRAHPAPDARGAPGCNRPLDESDGIRPTVLYPHRASVNHQNLTEFAKLDGPTEVYNAKEGGNEAMRYYLKDVQAQPKQELKVGAQVVLLTNLDLSRRLCNGSRGLVVGFEPIAAWKAIESGSTKLPQAAGLWMSGCKRTNLSRRSL